MGYVLRISMRSPLRISWNKVSCVLSCVHLQQCVIFLGHPVKSTTEISLRTSHWYSWDNIRALLSFKLVLCGRYWNSVLFCEWNLCRCKYQTSCRYRVWHKNEHIYVWMHTRKATKCQHRAGASHTGQWCSTAPPFPLSSSLSSSSPHSLRPPPPLSPPLLTHNYCCIYSTASKRDSWLRNTEQEHRTSFWWGSFVGRRASRI